MTFMRHRHVYDGEHHENERLQNDNQDMENRPAGAQDGAKDGAGNPGGSPHTEQQEYDFAGIHVAVEPQGMRKGLGNVLNHVEHEIRGPQERI